MVRGDEGKDVFAQRGDGMELNDEVKQGRITEKWN
jgi:hypothetical protein